MNPHPMDDPAFTPTVKAMAFEAALPMVVETLTAIANAADRTLAARAQGFGLSDHFNVLDDDDRSHLEIEIGFKTVAIAADQIKRLLPVTQRLAFEDGLKARDTFDGQAIAAAGEMRKAQKSNG